MPPARFASASTWTVTAAASCCSRERPTRRGRSACSNDPVCAQHRPDHVHEERFLHGAACHGCLLGSEPSCEWSNEVLDRALVVDTVEDSGAAFFGES